MRRIDYSNKKKQYIKAISREINITDLQKNWEILRNSIISKINSNPSLGIKAEDIFPENVEKILIGEFEVLNKIYNYSNLLDKNQKKYAKQIFRYDFSADKIAIDTDEPGLLQITASPILASAIADFFIHYSEELDITSCFYCETNYINAYPIDNGQKRQFQLDHFFGKADCPITAISLYNFVPSCAVCNGPSIKGKKSLNNFYNITTTSNKIYDYSIFCPTSSNYKFDENVTIEIKQKNRLEKIKSNYIKYSKKFRIDFSTSSSDYKKEIKAFYLEERYNYENNKKEALNLLELKQKFPDSYISLISKTLSKNKIYLSPSEIEEVIFHKRADKKSHRIFGKMKDDILN